MVMEVSKGPALFPTGLMLSLENPQCPGRTLCTDCTVHRNPRDEVKRGSRALAACLRLRGLCWTQREMEVLVRPHPPSVHVCEVVCVCACLHVCVSKGTLQQSLLFHHVGFRHWISGPQA